MLKLDSRQHCTKTKRTSQWTETYPSPQTNKGMWSILCHRIYEKIFWRNKFLQTYKSKILFSGILKGHLTKYEHAVFYNIHEHYDEKTNATTQRKHRWMECCTYEESPTGIRNNSCNVGTEGLTRNKLAQRNFMIMRSAGAKNKREIKTTTIKAVWFAQLLCNKVKSNKFLKK